jgi:hypothetical protein
MINKPIALVIGAGAVGRGLLIPTLLDSGFRIIVHDKNELLMLNLDLKKWYPLCGHEKTKWIGPIGTINNHGNIEANIVFISVKENNLFSVAMFINHNIDNNVPIYVIENATRADILLHKHLNKINKKNNFVIYQGIANVIVPISPFEKDDPLYTVYDPRGKLILEHAEGIPILDRAYYVNKDEFAFEWEMKLFLHCTLHVISGYIGITKGFEYVHEAVHEPNVVNVANGIANALTVRHRGRGNDIRKRLEQELNAMGDNFLMDDVY